MRKNIKTYEIGDTIIKKGFLIIPKTINNEMRWFENAIWKRTYVANYEGCPIWENSEWIN